MLKLPQNTKSDIVILKRNDLQRPKRLNGILKRILIIVILVILYNLQLYISFKQVSQYVTSEKFSLSKEWVTLRNQLFIRKSAVFYYYDERMIEALVVSETIGPKNLSCRIQTLKNNSFISEVSFVELASSDESILRLYAIKCSLNTTQIGVGDFIFLFVRDDRTNEETTTPIRIKIQSKELTSKRIKTKGKFMLCSKYFSIRNDTFDEFKMWIDLNFKIGFEKIVLFNVSIPNDDNFKRLFKRHKGSLEIRDYKDFPYLDNYYNEDVAGFRVNKDQPIRPEALRVEQIHEHVAINECYMDYRTYYDHIAQYDLDELIVPKMSFRWKKNLSSESKLQCGSNVTGKSDLEVYFDRLYEIEKYKDAESLWFKYADVQYNVTTNELIENLKVVLNRINPAQPNDTLIVNLRNIRNKIHVRNMTFEIKSRSEYLYAKYLGNLFNELNSTYEGFMNQSNRFHTALLLFNLTNFELINGKSIHKTKHVRYIGQHFTYTSNSTHVNVKHGHVIHFRTRLKFLRSVNTCLSIKQVYIDYKYIECYVKRKIVN